MEDVLPLLELWLARAQEPGKLKVQRKTKPTRIVGTVLAAKLFPRFSPRDFSHFVHLDCCVYSTPKVSGTPGLEKNETNPSFWARAVYHGSLSLVFSPGRHSVFSGP